LRRPTRISRRSFTAFLLGSVPAAAIAQSLTDPLPSWRDGATKRAILEFLRKTTSPESSDYVPPSERVAVFDNDGTLWVEQPIYTQVAFAVERLKALLPQHPEWKGRDVFEAALANDIAAVLQRGGLTAIGAILVATQAGTTPDAFHQIVSSWLVGARHPRFQRPYTECIYQPMLEVVTLFRASGYRTYIVTGGTVEFLRPWTQSVYGVPPGQVVGTTLKLSYRLHDGHADLVQLPEVEDLDEGQHKAANISKIIGQRPLAAFGNSDGDYEMLQFTTTGQGARLGVLIHHDDDDREYAYDRSSNIGKLDRGLSDAAANGWLVTSMKNDWSRVFR
jgi:haloacid dehalogenase-like hydrolase